jgi:hypothetical protein
LLYYFSWITIKVVGEKELPINHPGRFPADLQPGRGDWRGRLGPVDQWFLSVGSLAVLNRRCGLEWNGLTNPAAAIAWSL